MLCLRKDLVAKKCMDKREGEVSRFSFESILSHSAEICRWVIFQCFFNFVYRIDLDERLGGECQGFPSKHFCLTVPKKICRGTL